MYSKKDDKIVAVETKEASDKSMPLTVESTGNHVYFYAHVDEDRCLALMQQIRSIDNTLQAERISRNVDEYVPIWLHINSYGGSLFAGLGVADQLKLIQSPIYSIVEGCCASAATLISMSCTKRYIMPSAYMLIHQLSSFAWGTYEAFKDEMHLLDMLMDTMIKFYTKNSSLKKKEIRRILKHDSWFNVQECIANGFVDRILK